MNKLAYVECPTGIAGDMCLGALVHAGVPLDYLAEKLGSLGIDGEFRLSAESVRRSVQQATKVYVSLNEKFGENDENLEPPTFDRPHHHDDRAPCRHLEEIETAIVSGTLPARARDWSLAVFRKLAEAEGAVHGISPQKVHFHEVGATDAIVDIVGTCLGLDWLGIDRLYCSALPTGGGTVRTAHGILPVPAPAVLKLWEMRQIPVYSNGIDKELVTPTGAALAVTLAQGFGSPPPMTLKAVGLGAGSRDFHIPNILRLWIGQAPLDPASQPTEETIAVLETQIDDASPQAIAYAQETLFQTGALDVFTQPIGMKKSRSGILLTVICHPQHQAACESVLFRETPTLGIRRSTQQRVILPRQIQTVGTPHGDVRVKVATGEDGNAINVQPEFDDCARIARDTGQPWQEIHRIARQCWHSARG